MDAIRLKKSDLKNLATSFSQAFNSQGFTLESSVDYLSVKYANYSTSSHLPTWAFVKQDLIACSYSVLQVPYDSSARSLNVGLVCDVLTKPDFQKQGLFQQIGYQIRSLLVEESIDFTIGFPIRHEITSQHLKVGWKHLFDMNFWVSPSIPFFLSQKDYRLTSVENFFSKNGLSTHTENVISISDKGLSNRFSRLSTDYKVVTILNSENFAVVRKAKVGRLTFLAIIHLDTPDKKSARRLISALQTYGALSGLPFVGGCWNHSYAKSLGLSKLGLIKTPKVQNFIAREINSKINTDETQYRLSWLDSDAI